MSGSRLGTSGPNGNGKRHPVPPQGGSGTSRILNSSWSGPAVDPSLVTNEVETERKRIAEAGQFLVNAIMTRADFVRGMTDPRRDIFDSCGYPGHGAITVEMYQQLWDREAVAARAIEVLAKETHQVEFAVYENEDPEVVTPFEEGVQDLAKGLRDGGEESYYQDDEGNAIAEAIQEVDVISGVGHYGILLYGFDDRAPSLEYPVVEKEGLRLLFVRVFSEAQARIVEFESDQDSARYGQPTMYEVDFNTVTSQQQRAVGVSAPTDTKRVHWTRVLHVADNYHQATGSKVFAVPRAQAIFNNLLGIQKYSCSAPEMYWKGAFPGMGLKTNAPPGAKVNIDKAALRTMMENYSNDLQRYFALENMDFQQLSPQVVDPGPGIQTQIELICIKIGVPKRVFMGSERGELASTQDDVAWNDRLKQRQARYVTPRIIVPFFNRLIRYGVLPEPEGFSVYWPDLTSKSADEKATTAGKVVEVLSKYVAGGVEQVITPRDLLTVVMGFTDEEADMMLENAAEFLEEKHETEQEAMALEHETSIEQTQQKIEAGVMPDPQAPKAIGSPKAPKQIAPKKEPPAENEEYEDDEDGGGTTNANPKGCNQFTGKNCTSGSAPTTEKYKPNTRDELDPKILMNGRPVRDVLTYHLDSYSQRQNRTVEPEKVHPITDHQVNEVIKLAKALGKGNVKIQTVMGNMPDKSDGDNKYNRLWLNLDYPRGKENREIIKKWAEAEGHGINVNPYGAGKTASTVVTIHREPYEVLMKRYHADGRGDIDWRPTEVIPEDFYANQAGTRLAHGTAPTELWLSVIVANYKKNQARDKYGKFSKEQQAALRAGDKKTAKLTGQIATADAALKKAKAKLAALKTELKKTKADIASIKASVKKKVADRSPENERAADEVKKLVEGWAQTAKRDLSHVTTRTRYAEFKRTVPDGDEMAEIIKAAIGKANIHEVLKAYGFVGRQPSKKKAYETLALSVKDRIGSIYRSVM